jgi:uncharacterized protein
MALFAVHCLDAPGALPRRLEQRPAHKAHLATAASRGVRLKLSGPLLDGARNMCGSLFVMEAADHATVAAYVADDPFARGGIWGTVTITGFEDLTPPA